MLEWVDLPSRRTVLEQIISVWRPAREMEEVLLDEAISRIAAETIRAVHNVPIVRASAMDGIAVKSSAFQQGQPDVSQWKLGQEYVRADTGDDFSDEYDAVIAIEQTVFEAGQLRHIKTEAAVLSGQNVLAQGSYLKKDELLVQKGSRLMASDLAALAAGGISRVAVMKKPKIAFIPTGSELVIPGTTLKRGQQIDSNSVLAKHMLTELGAEPICFAIVADQKEQLWVSIKTALEQADLVIINGGSSKGDEDYNASILKQKGEWICHGVAAAPGKPMCVAMINQKPVINIPGPSLAAYYGISWCVGALIQYFLGMKLGLSKVVEAVLQEEIRYTKGMEILCKMELWLKDEQWYTRQVPFKSATVTQNLIADGKFVTDPKREQGYRVGEKIQVEIIR